MDDSEKKPMSRVKQMALKFELLCQHESAEALPPPKRNYRWDKNSTTDDKLEIHSDNEQAPSDEEHHQDDFA